MSRLIHSRFFQMEIDNVTILHWNCSSQFSGILSVFIMRFAYYVFIYIYAIGVDKDTK